MLANILALVVGLGSLALYMAAFFFPEVHRKNDFLWSGVGLFYALVLWFCAGQITGAVLLGQFACVALLGALGWQLVTLRRSITPTDLQTPISVESFNQSTTETVTQLTTNLRNGSWLKALPKLAASVKESLQFGFNDSPENRLSRLARARSAKKRKLKRRYEYEFVEDTPRDRKVQTAVSLSPDTELTEGAIAPPETETRDLPEITIAPKPSADESISVKLGKTTPDESAGKRAAKDMRESAKVASPQPEPDKPTDIQAAKDRLEEPTVTESAADWAEPLETAATSTNGEIGAVEELDASFPDGWNLAESTQPDSPPLASSTKHSPKTAFGKVIILKEWMQELIVSFTRPKPKYSMIELPSRPPSIPRPAKSSGVEAAGAGDEFEDDEFEDDRFEAVLEASDEFEKTESQRDESFSADEANDFEY